jgi:hypothetical protein
MKPTCNSGEEDAFLSNQRRKLAASGKKIGSIWDTMLWV